MRRRLTTFLLAAFYLLQATWLLHAGADLLFPRVRVVAATPDHCCTNRCGCPEEARARKACCCVEGATETARPAAPRPLSSIEEARCKGAEASMAQAFTQPVVCNVAWISLPPAAGGDVVLPEFPRSVSPSPDALDKVPIVQT